MIQIGSPKSTAFSMTCIDQACQTRDEGDGKKGDGKKGDGKRGDDKKGDG